MLPDKFVDWLFLPTMPFKNGSTIVLMLIWGSMLVYLPTYANIENQIFGWLFYIIGSLLYLVVIFYSIETLKNILKDTLFSSIFKAIILTSLAVTAHLVSLEINGPKGDLAELAFRGFATICMMFASAHVIIGLQYFYSSEDKRKIIKEIFSVKNIIAFVSGMIAFLTILIPFIQMMVTFFQKS